jgi:hypothetical protein
VGSPADPQSPTGEGSPADPQSPTGEGRSADPRDPDSRDDEPEADEPQGSDFALDPPPARSDQLPEDGPEPIVPD